MGIWKQRIDESWLKCTGDKNFTIINAKGGTVDPSGRATAISLKHQNIDNMAKNDGTVDPVNNKFIPVNTPIPVTKPGGLISNNIGENGFISGANSYVLDYYFGPSINDVKKFSSNKNYQFKTHVFNFAYAENYLSQNPTGQPQTNGRLYNSSLNIFKGALGINPTWDDLYYFDVPYYNLFDKQDSKQPTMYILYYYSRPKVDSDSGFVAYVNKLTSSKKEKSPSTNPATYTMDRISASQSVYAAGYGIAGTEINEFGWKMQGYSFVSYDNDPGIGDYKNLGITNSYSGSYGQDYELIKKQPLKKCIFGKGWYYDDENNEYTWYDRQFDDVDLDGNNNPVGGAGSGWNSQASTLDFQESHYGYRENNFIAKYIPFQRFNISFLYECLRTDSGIKLYLSPTLPSSKPLSMSSYKGLILFPAGYATTLGAPATDPVMVSSRNQFNYDLPIGTSADATAADGISNIDPAGTPISNSKYTVSANTNIYTETSTNLYSTTGYAQSNNANRPIATMTRPNTSIPKGSTITLNFNSEYANNGNNILFDRTYIMNGTYSNLLLAFNAEIAPKGFVSQTHPWKSYIVSVDTNNTNQMSVSGTEGGTRSWWRGSRWGRVYTTLSYKEPTNALRSSVIKDFSNSEPNRALVNNIFVDDENTNLTEIRVNIKLRHTYVGDLIINLRVPNGNVINLKAKYSGDFFNDLRDITFTTKTDSPKLQGLNLWPTGTKPSEWGYVWDPIGIETGTSGKTPALPLKAPWLPNSEAYNFDWAQLSIRPGLTFQMDKNNGQGTVAVLDGFNNINIQGEEEVDFRSNSNELKHLINEDGTFGGIYSLYIKDDWGGDSGIFEDWSIDFFYKKVYTPILALTQSDVNNINNPGAPKLQYLLGLEGNQYLFIVGDKVNKKDDPYAIVKTSTGTASLDNLKASLKDLKIDGGYHEANNRMYRVSDAVYETMPSTQRKLNDVFVPSSNPSGGRNTFALLDLTLSNISYSSYVGFGNINDPTKLSISGVNTKIGNGRFISGIWENGAWNSGWRKDDGIQEFYSISEFFSYNRDKRWRFSVTGSTTAVSKFEVGDKVSIGNIATIDINGERKLIKNYFTIMGKDADSIEVEFESDFPIRSIKIDSDIHRIYMTKNVWLTGGFFNGYFSGIWNHGLFKGFPYITEMFDTHWIDGKLDGGHFQSRKKSVAFSNTYLATLSIIKVGLLFDAPHKLTEGDSITISSTFSSFGSTTILSVPDDYRIITDIDWDSTKDPNTYGGAIKGVISTNISTGLLQNLDFNANNVSTITSLQSMENRRVFMYDSWMDVNFDNTSAVNIGRPQSTVNNTISTYAYSDNNLYGYPTYDVLSSSVTFRDSFSNTIRNYRLGSKYKIYEDYIGDAGNFDEYFDITGWATKTGTYKTNTAPFSQARTIGEPLPKSIEFENQGWTFAKDSSGTGVTAAISFERTTEALDDEDPAAGKEIKINAVGKGGVLNIQPSYDIANRTNSPIEKQRYTVISFDMIQSIVPDFIFEDGNKTIYDDSSKYQPLIHFNNLNYALRKAYVKGLGYRERRLDTTYFPVYKNVNHVSTPNKSKIEYFYNKTNLSMFFQGNGLNGKSVSTIVIDNLKLYEVDMIPFFQYFIDDNINRSISVPYQAIAPDVEYVENDYSLLDNSIYGMDSFYIYQPSNGTIIQSESVGTIENSIEDAPTKPSDDFIYNNFSSITGLVLVSESGGTKNNWIYLTTNTKDRSGNVYRENAIRYNRSFSVEWTFDCTGGSGADGFCLQWSFAKDKSGGSGGEVGRLKLPTTINAISFLTYKNKRVEWWKRNSRTNAEDQKLDFRQTIYYWFDYNHEDSTGKVYYSKILAKPTTAQHSYTNFTFDANYYYIGFGAATGASNDNHILKSFKLKFQ